MDNKHKNHNIIKQHTTNHIMRHILQDALQLENQTTCYLQSSQEGQCKKPQMGQRIISVQKTFRRSPSYNGPIKSV